MIHPGNQQCVLSCLATDLDGTLIPLAESAEHHRDLRLLEDLLSDCKMSLVFVTGRHIASVRSAIAEYQLPIPRWILCDVGTSAFERRDDGQFYLIQQYADQLHAIVGGVAQTELLQTVASVPHLRLQEPEKQAQFKTSFYAPAERLHGVIAVVADRLSQSKMPCQIISSLDPFTGIGLIDLLPLGVSKAFALDWWCREQNLSPQAVIFAGDSGNDVEAFNAGYRTIIVGNAPATVFETVQKTHLAADWPDRLFHASQHATSGVLEGVRHYLSGRTGSDS